MLLTYIVVKQRIWLYVPGEKLLSKTDSFLVCVCVCVYISSKIYLTPHFHLSNLHNTFITYLTLFMPQNVGTFFFLVGHHPGCLGARVNRTHGSLNQEDIPSPLWSIWALNYKSLAHRALQVNWLLTFSLRFYLLG
jgi:hypothetical protein